MKDGKSAYKEAGVNLQAADSLVDRIKSIAKETYTKGVITDIGLFAGMFKLDTRDISHPILVSSTDGVGTKLKLAFALNKHDSIGIDLVAMNVNDIVAHGAKPLFFLDYFATGKLEVEQGEQVMSGIAEGCKRAGCALLGGETAELPGFYNPGEYDLSGFSVGIVDNKDIVDGSSIGVDNQAIGIASSGLHSNGYSLVRKIIDKSGADLHQPFADTGQTLGQVLLEPTSIYVKSILNLLRDFDIKGIVHITGGGFFGNIPRVLPKGVKLELDFNSWPTPQIFSWLKDKEDLSWSEMMQIFNCGIGMIIIVKERESEDILYRLQGLKEEAWVIGQIKPKKIDQHQVEVRF